MHTPDNQQPASGDQAAPSQAAQSEISKLSQDGDWMNSYLAGDKAKVAELTRLHQAAYPSADATPDHTEQADDWLSAPHAPDAYNFRISSAPEPSEADFTEQTEIKQALHAEGVPGFAVDVAVDVITRRLETGAPDEAALEQSMRDGAAELQRRHGAKAQEIINAARSMFQRLDARDPRIGDYLHISGAANDPHLIETLARLWNEKYSKR